MSKYSCETSHTSSDQIACEVGQWHVMECSGDRQKKVFVPN